MCPHVTCNLCMHACTLSANPQSLPARVPALCAPPTSIVVCASISQLHLLLLTDYMNKHALCNDMLDISVWHAAQEKVGVQALPPRIDCQCKILMTQPARHYSRMCIANLTILTGCTFKHGSLLSGEKARITHIHAMLLPDTGQVTFNDLSCI